MKKRQLGNELFFSLYEIHDLDCIYDKIIKDIFKER